MTKRPTPNVTKRPTPMDADDCVTTLDPKRQGEFPDPVRFPPIKGMTHAGSLITEHADGVERGGYRLETIWHPFYDTQKIKRKSVDVCFFQDPAGRSPEYTNVDTCGQLMWPKKFTLWELEFQFSDTPESLGLIDPRTLRSAVVTVRVGEKNCFKVPLIGFLAQTPTKYRAALCVPIHIPAVQYFNVILTCDSPPARAGVVRCALHGYLHRELC